MSLVVANSAIVELTDFDGLLGLIAPRPALIVSADDDPWIATLG